MIFILKKKMYHFWYHKYNYAISGSDFLPRVSQPAFTCSKLTIETLEQGVKYVQS